MNDAADTAEELFRALVRLYREGRLTLGFDYKRLNHIDCPVAMEADSNIWAYAVIAAALLALWLRGWIAALAVGALASAAYFTLGRAYVRRRLQRRIEERALVDLALWQRLWRFGGVALLPRDGGEACAAPAGNWMALVRRLRA